jgi:hypothetical protein
MWDEPSPAESGGRAVFVSSIGRIGAGDPVFGPLPRHPQAAEGQPNGFVADQPRGEALGNTDLGGQRQRPAAGGRAERAWALVQQRPQGLAGASVDDGGRGVGSGRLWLQRRKTARVEGMNGIAHRLVGAVQMACNRGRRRPLGTGAEDLAAAYGQGGRGPESGLQGGPLVRRERAYK